MNAAALLKSTKLIPVVTIENPAHAVPFARALLAGGLNTIEVTLRTESALSAVKKIAKAVPRSYFRCGQRSISIPIPRGKRLRLSICRQPRRFANVACSSRYALPTRRCHCV